MLEFIAGVFLSAMQPKIELPQCQTVVCKIERQFNENANVMKNIALCESSLQHWDKDGNVIRSKTGDSGLFQINDVHREEAHKLGINIDSLDGNIQFAKMLYDRNGVRDWKWSKHCWENK
jgi:hypothetical protein